MTLRACFLLLAMSVATPELRYFQYERPVLGTPAVASQTCLTLDAGIFAHAAPRLADLRLYRDSSETPYVIRLSAPVQAAATPINPLNLGMQGKQTVFDAAMPEGSYSDLDLDIAAQDFIATVTVSGSHAQAGGETRLGSYTIFDLTRQKLGRSTVLHLPESNFGYLHFQITGPITPANITGLTVERLPESQPRYQPVAQSAQGLQENHATVFELTVPAHVPVDRLILAPGSEPAMFSRDVRIAVEPTLAKPANDEADLPPEPSIYTGNLLRLHSTQDGHRIDEERLALDAPTAGFATPAKWTIRIENGDDVPLVGSIQLQMLERELCFATAGNARYTLFYGDPALPAPVYDYSALFSLQTNAARATAGAEQRNPIYQSRPDQRPFTEKHPGLLWAALIAVIALLGGIALRSSPRTNRSPHRDSR